MDAFIIQDLGVAQLARTLTPQIELHASTQMTVHATATLPLLIHHGFKRVVLAREVTVEEIAHMHKEYPEIGLEAFAHGALCYAYSGQCLMSSMIGGRSGNRGACAGPCRLPYTLNRSQVPYDTQPYLMSPKDLCLIERIEEYAAAGVDAFKIEGRMKSLYHAANTTRIYRHAVKLAGTEGFAENLPFWLKELDLINHRPYTSDLFNEFHLKGYDGVPYINKALFVAYRTDEGESDEILVKTFNPLYRGEKLECIYPIGERVLDKSYIVEKIYLDDQEIEMARPNSIYRIKLDSPVFNDAIFRRPVNLKEKN